MGTQLGFDGIIDLQTLFEVVWLNASENPRDVSAYTMWTRTTPVNSKRMVLHSFGAGPTMRQWVGEKVFQTWRHYDITVDVKKYEKSIALDGLDVRNDPSGIIAQKLQAWFGTGGERDIGKVVWDSFTSNSGDGPTAYDGVSLFNTAHPHVNSGSGHSNKGTAALTVATYQTQRNAMRDFKDESGEYFGTNPTHMMVGTENETMARQIAQAVDRVVAVNASGVEATSSVVAAAPMQNIFRGEVDVIVNPKCGNDWYLFDLSDPNRLPFGWMQNRAPELISKNRMEDEARFQRDEEQHSIEMDGSPYAGFWPAAIGNIVS